MTSQKPKYKLTGLYVAMALIAYAVLGALFNDLYLPGRRTSGIHLHYEALPPAALGLFFVATKFALDSFKKFDSQQLVQHALTVLAVCLFAFSLYRITVPSGRALATPEECKATFDKLGGFAAALSGESTIANVLHQRGLECTARPILKSYYECIQKAEIPSDVNDCHGESKALFDRKNAT